MGGGSSANHRESIHKYRTLSRLVNKTASLKRRGSCSTSIPVSLNSSKLSFVSLSVDAAPHLWLNVRYDITISLPISCFSTSRIRDVSHPGACTSTSRSRLGRHPNSDVGPRDTQSEIHPANAFTKWLIQAPSLVTAPVGVLSREMPLTIEKISVSRVPE